MIETWLSLAILFCPLPDTSTPEATAEAFGKEWLRLRHDDDWTKHDDLEPAKKFFSDQGWKFVEEARKKSRKADEEWATLNWSFKVQDVKVKGDGTATAILMSTVRRNRGVDYKTKKVRVGEDRIPHKLSLIQEGVDWKVTELHVGCGLCYAKGVCKACTGQGLRSCYSCKGGKTCKYCQGAGVKASGRQCWSCKGKGQCRPCKGKGGTLCYSCKGAKKCKYCKGKAYKPAKWGMYWGGDPGAVGMGSEDRTTPTSAAQAFLNYRLVRWRVRSMRAKKRYAILTPLMAAGAKAKLEAAFSNSKAAERLKVAKGEAVVQEVEVAGSTAFARIVTTTQNTKPGGKPYVRITRVTFTERAGVWLIDNVQSDCYSCKGSKTCRTCKGKGFSRKCTCRAGKCAVCRGAGQRFDRAGNARDCGSCKASGKCFMCKGTGKQQCFGCRPGARGKCYSCRGSGWVSAGSRGIF